MDFNPISSNTTTAAAAAAAKTAQAKTAEKNAAENTQEETKKQETAGAVYEKGSDKDAVSKTESQKSRAKILEQLKADAEKRNEQLRSIVEKMMTKQGQAIGNADSMWSFLAKGNYTVDAQTKAQAQKDIAEDGYWGVEQTSDRILDFAKALSGDDPDKADELLDAVKKGFKEATKSWGDKMPDITQRTYDAVVEKFDKWKNGTEDGAAQETAI